MLPRFARPQNQEEEKLLEETQEHLKTYAEDGLRTLMTGIRQDQATVFKEANTKWTEL